MSDPRTELHGLAVSMENANRTASSPGADVRAVEYRLSRLPSVSAPKEALLPTAPTIDPTHTLGAISASRCKCRSVSDSHTATCDIRPKILDNLKGRNLTEALQAYAQRAKRGLEDAALLSGTGKDLLEATAKHIIHTRFGVHPENANFPALMGQAYAALQMATPETPKELNEPAIRDYERAIFSMATAINRVRNKEGTGHGRLCISALSDVEAHSIIESVGVVAEFLLNRLHASG